MIYCIFVILVIMLQSSSIFFQHVLFFVLLVPVTLDILYIPLYLHTPTHSIPSLSLSVLCSMSLVFKRTPILPYQSSLSSSTADSDLVWFIDP